MSVMGQSGMSGMAMAGPDEALPLPGTLDAIFMWLIAEEKTFSDFEGTIPSVPDGVVANWVSTDSEGEKHALQAVDGPILKANQINGLRALRFDGVDDRMAIDLYNPLSLPTTVFFIVKQTGALAGKPVWLSGGAGPGLSGPHQIGVTAAGKAFLNLESEIDAVSVTDVGAAWNLWCFQLSATDWQIRLNGVVDASGSGTYGTMGAYANIGGGGAQIVGMDLAEFIMFGRILTEPEIVQTETYLMAKYFP